MHLDRAEAPDNGKGSVGAVDKEGRFGRGNET